MERKHNQTKRDIKMVQIYLSIITQRYAEDHVKGLAHQTFLHNANLKQQELELGNSYSYLTRRV